jgi:hypothetical protein
MKNEALNQSQIAQKAVFDFDTESSSSMDYHKLAMDFYSSTTAARAFPWKKDS